VEISPITGIRAFPAKVPAADAKNWAVFEIENSSRTGDETYSSSGGKSAEKDEDEYEESAAEAEAQNEALAEAANGDEPELKALALGSGTNRKVSFFV